MIFIARGRTNLRRHLPFLHDWRNTLLGCLGLLVLAIIIGTPFYLVLLLIRWLIVHALLVAIAAIILSNIAVYLWLGHPGQRRRGTRKPSDRPPDASAS